jgi:hypothetical protein
MVMCSSFTPLPSIEVQRQQALDHIQFVIALVNREGFYLNELVIGYRFMWLVKERLLPGDLIETPFGKIKLVK